jgi:hypothetical protein
LTGWTRISTDENLDPSLTLRMTTTPLLVEEGLGVVHKPPPQLYYFIKATREDKKIVPFGEGWRGG